jgi:hypothetical protein
MPLENTFLKIPIGIPEAFDFFLREAVTPDFLASSKLSNSSESPELSKPIA